MLTGAQISSARMTRAKSPPGLAWGQFLVQRFSFSGCFHKIQLEKMMCKWVPLASPKATAVRLRLLPIILLVTHALISSKSQFVLLVFFLALP